MTVHDVSFGNFPYTRARMRDFTQPDVSFRQNRQPRGARRPHSRRPSPANSRSTGFAVMSGHGSWRVEVPFDCGTGRACPETKRHKRTVDGAAERWTEVSRHG
jgi:hypothetical protein